MAEPLGDELLCFSFWIIWIWLWKETDHSGSEDLIWMFASVSFYLQISIVAVALEQNVLQASRENKVFHIIISSLLFDILSLFRRHKRRIKTKCLEPYISGMGGVGFIKGKCFSCALTSFSSL